MTPATRTTTTNTKTGKDKSVKNEEWKNFESERTASVLASQAPPSTPVTSTATMDEGETGKLVRMVVLFFVPELIVIQHDSILLSGRTKICPAAWVLVCRTKCQ